MANDIHRRGRLALTCVAVLAVAAGAARAQEREPRLRVPRGASLFDAILETEVVVLQVAELIPRRCAVDAADDFAVPVTDVGFRVLAVAKQLGGLPQDQPIVRGPPPSAAARAELAAAPELPEQTVCEPPRPHGASIAGGLVGSGAERELWVPAGYPYFYPGQVLLVFFDGQRALSFAREALAFEIAPDGGVFRASDGRPVLGVRGGRIELGPPAISSSARFFASGQPPSRRRFPSRGRMELAPLIAELQAAFLAGGGELAAELCPQPAPAQSESPGAPAPHGHGPSDLAVSFGAVLSPGPRERLALAPLAPLPWSALPAPAGPSSHNGTIVIEPGDPCASEPLELFATGALRWLKYHASPREQP